MSNEQNKNCCCSNEENTSCGCEHNDEHTCCGDEHACNCGCEEHEPLIVELENENGEVVKCEVVDGFKYKDNEYAIVENPQEKSVYLFKVVGDDEVAELSIPDDDEFEEVREYYESLLED